METMAANSSSSDAGVEATIDFGEVDQYLQAMPLGSIAYNAPDSMLLGETQEVYLLLSPTASVADLQKGLESRIQGNQPLEGAQIKIAERMQASLTGAGFEVSPRGPQTQLVSQSEPTEWRWNVTPKQTGALQLQLDVYALLIPKDGTPLPRKIRTFSRPINVKVTFSQRIAGFVSGNWQWLWATFLVPLAGWFWAHRRRRKKRRA